MNTWMVDQVVKIDKHTLKKVKKVLNSVQIPGFILEEEASHIGASRNTVKRYLENLVLQKILDVGISYGSVSRPERRYFRKKLWNVFLNCELSFFSN